MPVHRLHHHSSPVHASCVLTLRIATERHSHARLGRTAYACRAQTRHVTPPRPPSAPVTPRTPRNPPPTPTPASSRRPGASPHGTRVGVLGGGQLGRMLAIAAASPRPTRASPAAPRLAASPHSRLCGGSHARRLPRAKTPPAGAHGHQGVRPRPHGPRPGLRRRRSDGREFPRHGRRPVSEGAAPPPAPARCQALLHVCRRALTALPSPRRAAGSSRRRSTFSRWRSSTSTWRAPRCGGSRRPRAVEKAERRCAQSVAERIPLRSWLAVALQQRAIARDMRVSDGRQTGRARPPQHQPHAPPWLPAVRRGAHPPRRGGPNGAPPAGGSGPFLPDAGPGTAKTQKRAGMNSAAPESPPGAGATPRPHSTPQQTHSSPRRRSASARPTGRRSQPAMILPYSQEVLRALEKEGSVAVVPSAEVIATIQARPASRLPPPSHLASSLSTPAAEGGQLRHRRNPQPRRTSTRRSSTSRSTASPSPTPSR